MFSACRTEDLKKRRADVNQGCDCDWCLNNFVTKPMHICQVLRTEQRIGGFRRISNELR